MSIFKYVSMKKCCIYIYIYGRVYTHAHTIYTYVHVHTGTLCWMSENSCNYIRPNIWLLIKDCNPLIFAQLAGAVKYTDCFSAEW